MTVKYLGMQWLVVSFAPSAMTFVAGFDTRAQAVEHVKENVGEGKDDYWAVIKARDLFLVD